ncbi:MAG TPA: pantoate--beta-alanine ligase [Terriglobales bacterium]|nr:pantoate--beta-alanine ligase [Terriglobales bacterium]
MRIISSTEEMQAACRELRRQQKPAGLVPTMGALHEGHLSLVRMARSQAKTVAVSIFVNPLQFGPAEDYGRYPRTFASDCRMLEAEGVDIVFAPSVEEMYPPDACTYVFVEGMSDRLCGRSRPGHFRGVTTVVAKLFNIVLPGLAFFGQKDAAQVAVLRRMARDLNFDLSVIVGPTVREADGLALSSRNQYLDAQQRKSAAFLYRALSVIERLAKEGESDTQRLIEAGKQVLAGVPADGAAVTLDYLEIADPETLKEVTNLQSDPNRGAMAAIAAYVGSTRLIDNVVLRPAVAD